MAKTINEVMTHDPITVDASTPIAQVARKMRDGDTGAILLTEDNKLVGIVTDRDMVVRALAEGRDPDTAVGDFASRDVRTLTPDQRIEDAVKIMREDDVRRIPVCQDGRPVGIVSIGDLAVERDPESALADISAGSASN